MNTQTNKKTKIIFLIAALILVLGLVLLSRAIDQIGKEDNVNSTETKTQSIIEKNNVDLPTDFPKYPNSELSDSWMRDTKETTGSSFILYTDDSKKMIFEFYKRELIELDWEIQNEISQNYILNILKDNTQGYLVVSDSTEGRTLISITFATTKK